MKKFFLTILIPISVVACSVQPTEPKPITSHTAIVSTVTLPTPALAPTQMADNDVAEEAEVRGLVEDFGKTLQSVSLLSPDAEKQIEKRYAEFVSPTLLERWISDVSKAPGRTVSSPWPDRIEISTLLKDGSDRYAITGNVVEVTSGEEVANGDAAAKIPVRIVVQNDQGRWLITEYKEER
ncbi:MAG: hypothetical protein PVJ21_16455 [Anaerolineales bacterium]|jgi:hypothetical protein